MGKTIRELMEHEGARHRAVMQKLQRAVAREKARNEVLSFALTGKLRLRQIKGDLHFGKVPAAMTKGVYFSLSKLVDMRAEELI